ncbi:hypothetical protein HAZT_HAZT000687 [Hyalella azteca]|uniref:adenylate cyclase n=1 Tax=Hyalella azteca TaxID=294128 RepID=A0A6A0GT30_HYAAZ|nr:hypothetical protein HAZT_HAZT000687 [Hyalella azteca]
MEPPADELYHESYNHVAVLFASIPNYSEFYKELEFNEEGRGCLKVLHEIIREFDMLTYQMQFLSIEKIKVVGSTYMAACGLQPGMRSADDAEFVEQDRRENVATLAAFAAAMMDYTGEIGKIHVGEKFPKLSPLMAAYMG